MNAKVTTRNEPSTSTDCASPSDVVRMLKDRGASMTAVARVCQVTPQMVRKVVFREAKSRRVALVIAEFLGLPLETLFPDQYPDRYTKQKDAMSRMQLAAISVQARMKARGTREPVAEAV